jgi:hypothetical protein
MGMPGIDGNISIASRPGGWSSVKNQKIISANLLSRAKSALVNAFAPKFAMAVA